MPPPQWEWMQKYDPNMYEIVKKDNELECRTMELTMQHRRLPEKQREEVRKELAKVVAEHFDVRQQRRELELKRLEEQIESLRKSLKKRADARVDIVRKRISELIGDKSDLEF